jgi:hypothetical protein
LGPRNQVIQLFAIVSFDFQYLGKGRFMLAVPDVYYHVLQSFVKQFAKLVDSAPAVRGIVR